LLNEQEPNLVNFVNQNLPAAITIADRLQTSVANTLGLSSYESANGASNLATNFNNYFSLTVGSAFPGSIGTYTTRDGRNFGIYNAPGFVNSGLSFAGGFQGARVRGTDTPSDFAAALTTPPLAFNSEPGYDTTLTNRIWTVQIALDCWKPGGPMPK
jgi:hypothetical protein